MIITVPESKKIYYDKENSLNENNNFMFDDILDDPEIDNVALDIAAANFYKMQKQHVIDVLTELDVHNYTITVSDYGIQVDVNNHLFLPNKKLNRFDGLFHFGTVEGNCNFTGNNLTNWSMFPQVIYGNCMANFNNLKNFDGAPRNIKGKLFATKQNKKTEYPLTDENYRLYVNNQFHENFVYSIRHKKFGELKSIHESNNTCVVEIEGKKYTCMLNQVNFLGHADDLFE